MGNILRYPYLHDGRHRVIKILLMPGRFAGGQFNKSTSVTPNICLSSVVGLFYDFRGHPGDAPLYGSFKFVTQARGERLLDLFGASKVRELDGPFVVEQNIGSLEVLVDHFVLVKKIKS